MNVKWLCDSYFQDRQMKTGFPSLIEAVKAAGHEVAVDKAPEHWGQADCVVVYGTKSFNIFNQRKKWIPGSYYRLEHLAYSGFTVHYGEMCLNNDFYLLPYNEFVRRGIKEPVFIRPDKTSKVFTGFVLTPENIKDELNALDQTSSVMENTLCVVSSVKKIDSEFRFVIADKQVVTGSEYRWDGILDVRSDVLPEAQALAEKIAAHAWQPDRVYVCDVAMSNGEAKLLELNPFSSSGLYSCDTNKIVQAVSQAAWSEFMVEDLY